MSLKSFCQSPVSLFFKHVLLSLTLQAELFFLFLFSFPTGCALTVDRAIRCLHMVGGGGRKGERSCNIQSKGRNRGTFMKRRNVFLNGGGVEQRPVQVRHEVKGSPRSLWFILRGRRTCLTKRSYQTSFSRTLKYDPLRKVRPPAGFILWGSGTSEPPLVVRSPSLVQPLRLVKNKNPNCTEQIQSDRKSHTGTAQTIGFSK